MLDHWVCLNAGELRLCVDPRLGGRVMEYSRSGRNAVLTEGPQVGSTFWPSPQSAWGWPPPKRLDEEPYQVRTEGNQIVLTSNVCPETGLKLEKHFVLLENQLQVTYVMVNASERTVQFAPWEITRLSGGVTFFEGAQPPLPVSNGKMQPAHGHWWHSYDVSAQTEHEKVFVNGSSGWLANADDGLMLLKLFEPLQAGQAAPGEAEIEVYGHGDSSAPYIEMEQQGAFQEIAVGQRVEWRVTWVLRELGPTQQDSRQQLIKEAHAVVERFR